MSSGTRYECIDIAKFLKTRRHSITRIFLIKMQIFHCKKDRVPPPLFLYDSCMSQQRCIVQIEEGKS